jgi:hypothetical protein
MRSSAWCRCLAVLATAAFMAVAGARTCWAQAAPPAAPAAATEGAEAEACFGAAERAQPLLRQKRFRDARAVLEVCARDVCPKAAKTDCRQWLNEAIDAQPSILIVAHEIRGHSEAHDVHGVKATVDATVVVEDADASPLNIDPGRHRIKLERPDFPPIEQNVEVHEGDKNRLIDFTWRSAAPAAATRPVPASVYATLAIGGGVGIVGAIFEGIGLSKRGGLSACEPNCPSGAVTTARNWTAAGDVSLGAAALFGVSTAILYLVRPTVEPAAGSPESAWLLEPVRGGIVGGLRLRL